jgi:hypothetical protein
MTGRAAETREACTRYADTGDPVEAAGPKHAEYAGRTSHGLISSSHRYQARSDSNERCAS